MAPKITLHWLEHSRAQRIIWLLEELELPYELKTYERTKELLAPKELREVHPLGKSPVITVEDNGKTTTIAESGAITEWIIQKYGAGKLKPAAGGDEQTEIEYLYWLHWAEGTAMTPLMFSIVFAQMPKQAPFIVRPLVSIIASQVMSQFVRPNLKNNFSFVERTLEGKDFFVDGKLTGADIMMSFVMEGIDAGLGWQDYPNIKRVWDGYKQREAYKRAEGKGGANDLKVFL